MADYYADTSALIKRSLPERGSAWVQALCDPAGGNTIITSVLAGVEAVSALARRCREGVLSAAQYDALRDDFLAHYEQEYQVVPLTEPLQTLARNLLERHPLRAYDALHLAAALLVSTQLVAAGLDAPIFLAADERLLAAARAEGLSVDTPHAHP
jgi:predicted nucleic acid-binding protein